MLSVHNDIKYHSLRYFEVLTMHDSDTLFYNLLKSNSNDGDDDEKKLEI